MTEAALVTVAVGDQVKYPVPRETRPRSWMPPELALPPVLDEAPDLWRVVIIEPEHDACTIERWVPTPERDAFGFAVAAQPERRWVSVDEISPVEILERRVLPRRRRSAPRFPPVAQTHVTERYGKSHAVGGRVHETGGNYRPRA